MTIEKRPFGQTGHMSSAVIFGGAALWDVNQRTADKALELLLEYGINHIDVAPRYGNAELRVGNWMKKHRKNFFLATKTGERSYQGAKEEVFRSLDYLNTDQIDLIQLHSLTHPNEWEQVFGPQGALEALLEAQSSNLIKNIGITGHGWTAPAMHQKSLNKFRFDSVLMPWNWFASHHRNYPEEFNSLLAFCKKHKIAVQTIKGIARGPWAAGKDPTHTTWYQPIENASSIEKSVHWILGQPDIFLNSTGDLKILPMVLEAARTFSTKPNDDEMRTMSKKEGLTSIFGI